MDCHRRCVLLFPFFLAFCQSEKSKQPSEGEEEESERPSEQETPEDMFNLAAEVKELREIVSERERKQMKSEVLQNQMVEEWKQMKQQFQHVLKSKESKYHLVYIIVI